MKKILMIATGGTIASLDQGDGLSPAITSAQLLSAVPEVSEICEAEAMQLMNLDSTNMTPECWLRIAEQIRRSYDDYDGFVVTHGTDTMAYTAAALSYLIQKSPKPIVMTGSQKSIFLRDTDARQNVQDSFRYAVFPGAQGVSLVFDGKVILGTRARKERTKSLNAFSSVDYPEIAVIRSGKVIPYLPGEDCSEGPVFYNSVGGKILVLTLVPGLTPEVMHHCLPDYDALVLQSFGVGGLPESDGGALADGLRAWVEAGKTVVVTTQVPYEGSDMKVYHVGQKIKKELNLIEAYSMTLEAVVTKLRWILARTRDPREVHRLFYIPVRHDIIEA